MSQNPPPPIPDRFQVARPTLLFDRFMTGFINFGGIAIIVAVSLIFVFILIQIWPLFAGAKVTPRSTFEVPLAEVRAFGVDEYGELPFFVGSDGRFHFLDTVEGPHNRGSFSQRPTSFEGIHEFPVVQYNPRDSTVLFGTDDGRFAAVKVDYRATYPPRGGREVVADLAPLPLLPIGRPGNPITNLDFGDAGQRKLAAAVQRHEGRPELYAVTMSQTRTLFGVGPMRVQNQYDLTAKLQGEPQQVLIPWEADSILVATTEGAVNYIFLHQGEFYPRQVFRPFADLEDPRIATMDFILGDVSIVFTSHSGEMRVWSLYRDPETNRRLYGQTKSFPRLPGGGASFYSASLRNKAFLTGNGSFVSLRYMTTEDVRWENTLPWRPRLAQIGARYDFLALLADDNRIHFLNLIDKHPIASWKSYFGKIQYEGQAAPSYTWQSTGGRDDFERKLSLVPLIIGTLKGTVYALFFAVPIALLGALYTSQFMRPAFKRYVKPTMEIMASLPSVVLGFLAALWLAPIVSNAVPSVLLAVAGMVIGSLALGWGWGQVPQNLRMRVPPGYEFLIIMPAIILCSWVGWQIGPITERVFFTVTDPLTGHEVADFRLWFPHVTGLAFEQRNAFVVGFVMGFAVIPIIFTISEDSMSNVPEAFRSGSLALGASRWQTAIKVVIPTASAGIFSALMIGLGRAVGETMIVVMATGNVPVTEFNPFTGMRTLSANIAVELPEAPYLGTLYRTLFLGAMVLFLMTFIVNTFAEILRQRLRNKYRAVE